MNYVFFIFLILSFHVDALYSMQQSAKQSATSFVNAHNTTVMKQALDDSLVEHVIKNAPQKLQLFVKRLCDTKRKVQKNNHLLLVGKPGCGKTTLAQAIALKSNRLYKLVGAPLIGDRYQNSATKDLEAAFNDLIVYGKPSVLIIDEVTSFTRSYDKDDAHEQDKKTTEAFWLLLDQIKNNPNILVIMTTNYPEKIPQQIKSRLRKQPIEIPLPDSSSREALLKFFLPKSHTCSARDLNIIAWCTKNLPHRDLEYVIEEAIEYAEDHGKPVSFCHFKEALAEKNIWLSWPWRWIPTMPWPENPKEFLSKVGYGIWQVTPLVLNVLSMYLQYKQALRAYKNAQQQHQENCRLHRESQEKQQRNHEAQMAQALKFHIESQNKQQLLHDKNMEQTKAQAELQEKSYKLTKEGQELSTRQTNTSVAGTIGAAAGLGLYVAFAKEATILGATVAGPIGAGIGAAVGFFVLGKKWLWG